MGADVDRLDQRIAVQQGQDQAPLRHGRAPCKAAEEVPIVFVNLVGGNDGIIFDGASLIADEEGDIILQAAAFEEFVETVELDVRKPDARGITGDEMRIDPTGTGSRHSRLRAKNGFKKLFSGFRAVSIRRWSRHSRPKRSGRRICFA